MRVFQPIQPQKPYQAFTPAVPAKTPDAVAQAPQQTAPEAIPARSNRFSVHRTAGAMPVWRPQGVDHAAFAPETTPDAQIEAGEKLGFKDLIDVINPLQHIPVVSTIYRHITGDAISPGAEFMGGMLFGGPIGGAAALANVAFRDQTGKGFGETIASMVSKDDGAQPAQAATPRVLAARWEEPSRMAGAQPVWQSGAPTPSLKPGRVPTPVIPGDPLAGQTKFAILLNDLATTNPNMS